MNPLQTLAEAKAALYGLPPALVDAIVEQESGWDTDAIRYEPAFYDKYVAPQALASATEARARAFSWGLMQVMGQVAREVGFGGKFLSELCQPDTGLDIGCKVFVHKLAKAGGDIRKALLLWNGGGNVNYPDQVLARVPKYGALANAASAPDVGR